MEKKCLCKQCGRSYIYNGHNSKDYCDKHGHQIKKFGKFLDTVPRTKYDPNEFRVTETGVEFDTYTPITGGVTGTFKIDFDDYLLVSKYKWYRGNHKYAMTRVDGKPMLLHRLICNPKPGQQVDHIDLDITNNRKSNLRICGNSVNQQNKRGYNKYDAKGVERTSSGKWSAYFRNGGKQYHSQGYLTKEEAAFARYLLEQLFGTVSLSQQNQELINALTQEQREFVVRSIEDKFNI